MDNDDSEEEDVIILTAERSDVIQKRYVWTQKEKRLQKGKVIKLFVNSVFLSSIALNQCVPRKP